MHAKPFPASRSISNSDALTFTLVASATSTSSISPHHLFLTAILIVEAAHVLRIKCPITNHRPYWRRHQIAENIAQGPAGRIGLAHPMLLQKQLRYCRVMTNCRTMAKARSLRPLLPRPYDRSKADLLTSIELVGDGRHWWRWFYSVLSLSP